MNDINLATATPADLKAYAANHLDLKLSLNMNAETMRERILNRCKELQIDPPRAEIGGPAKGKGGKRGGKRVIINIGKQPGPGGSEPVPVAPQGILYTVPRGINVAVPEAVVEVLRNAKQDIVTQDPETGQLETETVYAYPFQVVGDAA